MFENEDYFNDSNEINEIDDQNIIINSNLSDDDIDIPDSSEDIKKTNKNDNSLSGVQKISEEKIKSEYKIVPSSNPNLYKLDPMLIILIGFIIGLLLFIGYKFSNNTDSDEIE